MLGAACAILGAALVTGAAVPATSPERPGVDSATVSLSSTKAGVRPVAVTVHIRTELRCGRLIGSIRIVLPVRSTLPATIRPAAVLVGGRPAGSVTVGGHTLSITPSLPGGVICDAISPGTAKIVLTRAARIGNPPLPGRYAVTVRYRGVTVVAVTRISS